ncbi:MAG TPA: hypothetical protein VGF55_19265 [Gemmataceae bacterium]|jgi:autotransporter-associated beta strand protein
MPPRPSPRVAAALAAALVALAPPPARGQSSWTGAVSNAWTDPGNWSTNSVPGAGGTAQFDGPGNGNTTITLGGAAQPINTVLFTGSPVAYTLGNTAGDALGFDAAGGAITVNTGVTTAQTFAAGVVANGALAVTNSGSRPVSFNGVIAGPGAITFSGAGSLGTDTGAVALNAQNTYSGGTSFGGSAQQPIRIGVSTVLDGTGAIVSGPFGTGTVTSNNGTPQVLQPSGGDRTVANPLTFTFGLFFANDATGNFNLTLTGAKSLTTANRVLTNNVNAGAVLTFGTPGTTTLFNLGTTGGRTLTVQTQQSAANAALGAGTLVINDVLANSTNGANGNIVVQNNANVILTNANTYGGTTSVTSGRLLVNNTSGSGTGTGTVTARGTTANTVGGGTLGGSGSIAGLVNIGSTTANQQGGIIAPGNSIGTITVGTGILAGAPAMSWKPFGSYAFEHQPDATQFNGGTGGQPNPGTDNDRISGPTAGLDLSGLNNTSSSTQFTVNLLPTFTTNGFTPAGPVAYQAATFPSIALPAAPTTPFGTVNLVNGVTNATDVTSLFNFTGTFASPPVAAVNGGVLYFQFTPVPEPAFVLAACGFAALAGWRRWRAAGV